MDFSFIVDVIIGFRTTILIETSGQEITNCKEIAYSYLKGRFWIDLLASIPIDFLSFIFQIDSNKSSTFQLFGLLKLFRIFRLSKLITFLKLKDDMKMSLKLMKLIFFLFMYLHIVACIWFYLVKQDETWMPPFEDNSGVHLYDEGNLYQYCTSLYYTVLLLTGNDLMPQSTLQIAFLTVLLLAAAIINANIFGNIAVLLQQLNRKTANFQAKLENASSVMKTLGIEDELEKDIHMYLMSTQDSLDLQEELNKFLMMLSPSLTLKVTKHMFYEAFLQNSVFKT